MISSTQKSNGAFDMGCFSGLHENFLEASMSQTFYGIP